MAVRGYIDPIAMAEDEPIAWFPIDAGTPRQAKRSMADLGYEREPWTIWRVQQRWIRPFNRKEDCPVSAEAHAAAVGTDEDPPDDCSCRRLEEGWHFPCEADHPAAIPVWKVTMRDLRPLPLWKVRRWLARKAHRDGFWTARPVLWGGKISRKRTWLDRLLFGGFKGGTLWGDHQLKLGQGFVEFCPVCKRRTLHEPGYRLSDGHCLARGHYE